MNVRDSGGVGGTVDNTPTTTEYDRGALESKLEVQMDIFNGANDADAEVVDDDLDVVAQEEASISEEDDSQADQQTEEVEDSDEEVADDLDSEDEETVTEEAAEESGTSSDKTPTLPDTLKRSLVAYGWDDAQIEHGLATSGVDFIAMAATIHAKRNDEVARWAELGRKAQERDNSQATVIQPEVVAVPTSLPLIDLKKLEQKYGAADDDMLDEIVTPINATLSALNSVLPELQRGVNAIHQTQVDETIRQIHKFFDHADMDPYRKFYGGEDQDRSPEQLEQRKTVADKASEILAGARSLGREMSVEEALSNAHDVVASDFRENAVRKSIKRSVKKRAKGISQRPGRKKTMVSTGPSKTASERERKIGPLMAKAFGK